ncbi:Protein of unknown function [Rubritalea squalenifaciens DSM 18772]|uniref:Lipopolysaccharide assembly protein A domain-containing protein n=2 Tax=Rubritalea TaxID=361050 RepID=A0A1M6BBG7_9BACT|nr:LapA family protein [Rubritalea squalenifaciens]SHI46062.1 Protein of unknown function [Rubritalea squalenifaciens DSM 18772]
MTARKIKIIAVSLALLLVGVVIFQNTGTMETKVLFARIEMPQAFMLFLTFSFGMLVGFVLAYSKAHKRIAATLKSKDS